jgi:nicotinamidase-related amidase
MTSFEPILDTDPYPWPYDGTWSPDDTALVLCGLQPHLCSLCPDADKVLASIIDLALRWTALGGSTVVVRHGARTGRRSLPIAGTPAWETIDLPLDPTPVVVDAAGWDGCFSSPLDHVLRAGGFRHVLLGGFASELTVDSTVRTLNDRGTECLVLVDACAPVDAALGQHAFHSLTLSGGIFGALGSTAGVATRISPLATAAPRPIAPASHHS